METGEEGRPSWLGSAPRRSLVLIDMEALLPAPAETPSTPETVAPLEPLEPTNIHRGTPDQLGDPREKPAIGELGMHLRVA